MRMSRRGNDCFYEDPVTGKRTDAFIHEPILAEGEQRARDNPYTLRRLLAAGYTLEQIKRLFG
jgi:hypothetical protein